MSRKRYLIIVMSICFFGCQFLVSCAPRIGKTYSGSLLPREKVACLLVHPWDDGNFIASIDGINQSEILDVEGHQSLILEIPVGSHEITVSYWKQLYVGGGSSTVSTARVTSLPLTFTAKPRHIYRVANAPSCPAGKWCPFVKDITNDINIEVPSNYRGTLENWRKQVPD